MSNTTYDGVSYKDLREEAAAKFYADTPGVVTNGCSPNPNQMNIGVNAWEIGYAFIGHPTKAEKRAELARFLGKYGDSVDAWWMAPAIRHHCVCADEITDQCGVLDFGRKYTADLPECSWAVYAVVRGTYPPLDYVPEGTRIPKKESL